MRIWLAVRVIVSEALPPGIRVFALKEGVWVSSVEGALPLATALRAQLVESARLQRAGQGKGLKMDEIYNYLTSPRFGERIQRMVETWQALEEQVASEEPGDEAAMVRAPQATGAHARNDDGDVHRFLGHSSGGRSRKCPGWRWR